MDKRKNYYLVVDTETAGGLDNPLVYDIGFAICDKKGNIYEKHSFIIEEIFDNRPCMDTAYYKEKIPRYLQGLAEGKHKKVSMLEARKVFLDCMRRYNVKAICAYNLPFDMGAIKNTMTTMYGAKARFLTTEFRGIGLTCIWSLCCQAIYTRPSFQQFVLKNGFLSEKGNPRTSAEIGYRYMTGDVNFIEEHTGLEDVEIEVKLLAYCIRQHKKMDKGIINSPWRLVANYFK